MKKIHSYFMLFIMALAFLPGAMVRAQGDLVTVTIQGDAAAMMDTQILASNPTTNYGTATSFGVGESNSSSINSRSLLEFDLSGLPANITVYSATVSLWVDTDQSDNARVMSAYSVMREWNEGQATWNAWKTSNNWTTAGASGTGDVETAAIGTVSVANDLAPDTQVDIVLDPAAVQYMARLDYFGFKLQMATENNDRYLFKSSDNATAAERPQLVIEYYPDTPVIDPGWKCYEGQFGGEFLYIWPDCENYGLTISPYRAGGASHSTEPVGGFIVNETAATLQCDPYPRCVNDYDIYYRIAYNATWTKTGTGLTSTLHTALIVLGNPVDDISMDCGTGLHGECYGVIEGTVPRSSLPVNTDGGYTLGVQTFFSWDDIVGGMTDRSIAWNVYFSLLPFDENCADTWFVPVPDTYTIDPTVETPVGYPTDVQKYATVIDAEYMVRVQHGPWNDGTDDRTDAEFSVDGVFWYPWEDAEFFLNVVCIDTDPTNPDYNVLYFTADHDDFYIRAADTPDNFADNTNDAETPFQYVIGVAFENVAAASCESQFTYDPVNDVISSVSVHGTDTDVQATDSVTSPIEAGGWYAIEVASGAWNESGGSPRVDMSFEFAGGIGATDWALLDTPSDLVWCQTDDGMITFIQAPGNADLELHLRVNDQDVPVVNFADNSGTLGVNIYHASFARTKSGCELQFDVGETLLKHDTVEGNASTGKSFATYPSQLDLIYWQGEPLISIPTGEQKLVPGGWYMLETVEGPWYTTVSLGDLVANTHYYNMEIRVGSGAWEPLEEWSDAECIVTTDTLGHVRVYFQVPDDTSLADENYDLRVASNSFMFTRGFMSWDLYGAVDMGYTGATGNCDNYQFDPDAPHATGEIESNVAEGQYINGLDIGAIYAIRIESANTASDPPFYSDSGWFEDNSSATELDGLQLTTDGTNFQALPDASGVLCSYVTPITGELVIFVQRENGQAWKMRADSSTFSNNVGSELYTVFQAGANGLDSWDSCIKDYSAHIPPLNPHEWITVTKAEGDLIASEAQYAEYNGLLAPDAQLPPEIWKDTDALGNYIIEIEYGSGPWYDGETSDGSSQAELSKDGGTTWELLGPDSTIVTCVTSDPLHQYWKALIQVETGDVWKIRVADSATETFTDNTGSLAYVLYSAGGFEVPPADNSNIGAINVQGGGDVCNLAPVSPGLLSLTDIDQLGNYLGSWVSYANLSVERYMAFCPRHTEMFFSVFDLIKTKEPFATLDEIEKLKDDIVRELESYGWDGQSEDLSFIWGTKSPSQIQGLVDQYVFEQGTSDPWANDGELLPNGLTPTAMPSSYAACISLLPDYKRFAEGLCFASSMMKETSAQFWIQLGFDVSMAVLVFGMISKGILTVIAMATGTAVIGSNSVNVQVEDKRK